MEGDFKFDITANLFHNSNEVTYLPMGDMFGEHSITSVGIPMGQIYVLDYLGIYTDESELDDHTVAGQVPELGDAKYRDAYGDGNNISEGEDRVIVGDPNPKLQYGLNFNGYWRNFEFSLFIQGVQGRDAFNAIKYAMNTSPITSYTGDYDPYIDGSGSDPRPTADFGSPNTIASGLFMEDASYLRMRSLILGYTFNPDVLKQKLGLSKLRVYVQGANLFTITNYSGLNPELTGSSANFGIDYATYPTNQQTYLVGINLSF